MADTKLFKIIGNSVHKIEGQSVAIEKILQTLLENHLDDFLGVRFLATEYSTGQIHKGRIDTLGVDENNCPVIIEYKRSINENVINQGLFYLDWLLDHKAEFKFLVQENLGIERTKTIDWNGTRLLCIASDFTRYDQLAVNHINHNIELLRYRRYGDDLLLLELVNSTEITDLPSSTSHGKDKYIDSSVEEKLNKASEQLKNLFEDLKAYIISLGDDVQVKVLKNYFAFKRIKNFACVEVHPQTNQIIIYVKSDFLDFIPEQGFTRDVRNIGHFATGDLEITITKESELEKAKSLIERSYQDN
ncbi:hypothetical protein SDC9_110119 [bioreactor metagenome]|uniref:DUF5655 domain-containing protein n=1 Tax=bioreactor metagenome TaxID=1076179 RepID=A0A645BCM7_9ZZZZ